MDIQSLLDSMSEGMRSTRQDYHLTLGELIEKLNNYSPSKPVRFSDGMCPCSPDSYRGYYEDLAFEATEEEITAERLSQLAAETLNSTLHGYKGGDYTMDENTPLWRSEWGVASGIAIVGVQEKDDHILLETKEVKH